MFRTRHDLPKKLNICFVAEFFPIPQPKSHMGSLWPVARRLVQYGHRVTILTRTESSSEQALNIDGVHLIGLATRIGFESDVLVKFSDLHAKDRFHVVHSLDGGAIEIGRRKKEFALALTYDVEATQMSQLFSILGMSQETLPSLLSTGINILYKFLTTYLRRDRKLLKSADGVFVTSPPQKMALERYYLYPEFKTHLVPYGIEIGDLSPREQADELRKKLKIPENGHVVVISSDMTELGEVKGVLQAFEKVAIKRASSRLIVIGNGPLFKAIEYEALSLALGSRVIFTGSVPASELPDYISLAEVYVSLSAKTSSFETSFLEAMAQKKVVVGSEVSSVSALIQDGVDGFLIRPADANTLAELMLQIFSGEIDHSQIGERARAKVVQLFDLDRMVQQTLAGFERALLASGNFKSSPAAGQWLTPLSNS